MRLSGARCGNCRHEKPWYQRLPAMLAVVAAAIVVVGVIVRV
jgi:hypothetical protein